MALKPVIAPKATLSETDTDRIIEMAWEDRTPFEAIYYQFGLTEDHVKELMKKTLKFTSYRLWRTRVENCQTKHAKNAVALLTVLNAAGSAPFLLTK